MTATRMAPSRPVSSRSIRWIAATALIALAACKPADPAIPPAAGTAPEASPAAVASAASQEAGAVASATPSATPSASATPSTSPPATPASPSVPAAALPEHWLCGEQRIAIRTANGDPAITLTHERGELHLPAMEAASGARYADANGNEFWSKGDSATLTLSGLPARECGVVQSGG